MNKARTIQMGSLNRLRCGLLLFLFSCLVVQVFAAPVLVGAARFEAYEPFLVGRCVGLVCNHTSRVGERQLWDTLQKRGITLVRLFTPEHGLEGIADAGEHVRNQKAKRELPEVVSLYGAQKRPPKEKLQDLDILLFDLQDVGVRCYTYLSTLHYVMEACAQTGCELIVLDRPNPNGHFVDGPTLSMRYRSFVGMHPVPWVHGMTVGEYARMIRTEGWLKDSLLPPLRVVRCEYYTHTTRYEPPVPPSPNLPTLRAILLYPSLAFFEGTNQSVGRGTETPFEVVGSPQNRKQGFFFIPKSRPGAKHPPHIHKRCYGLDLRNVSTDSLYRSARIRLSYLKEMYKACGGKFFQKFFTQLAGTTTLRTAIERDDSEDAIRATWQSDLKAFKQIRAKYLLYTDFDGLEPRLVSQPEEIIL